MQIRHLEYHDAAEANHWWFAARRQIVLDLIARILNGTARDDIRLLDIGCGAGGMLNYLARWGTAVGVDSSAAAVELARRKTDSQVLQGSLPDGVPFADAAFDVITLLDVVEHVQEDVGALDRVARMLRPGGFAVLTVPAYRFLWSEHDVVNEHKRRYTRTELRRKLEAVGLVVRKISYYNMFLFPPIAMVRLLRRLGPQTARADEGRVPPVINAILRTVFASEAHLLNRTSLPFGISVIAVAERPAGRPDGGGNVDDA
jgi:SAM-dependent methyltransferase